jgi:hypothetical protein
MISLFGYDEPLSRVGLVPESCIPAESTITNDSHGSVGRSKRSPAVIFHLMFLLCSFERRTKEHGS